MIRQRSVAEVVILSIVTCGIYLLYWYYVFARDVKEYLKDETIDPGLDLILCIVTCGIYTIYWVYKYGKLIARCQQISGRVQEDNSILYLVLQILNLGVVNAALMQSSMNTLLEI